MLKEIRIEKKLTQQEVATLLGISLRSYKSYENDKNKRNTIKYNYLLEKLQQINPINEEEGILEIEDIKRKCHPIFGEYKVEYCYLFGSYAKGKAKGTSDVDLLISVDVTGLKFFGLVEVLRETLHKRVDVIAVNQLKDNIDLTKEVLKDGIKIYG